MLFVPGFAVVCLLSSAGAGEYASPEGFKLTYPESWKSASKEQLDKVAEATQKMTKAEPPNILTFVYGPPSEGFAPNINVVLPKSRMILNSATEEQMIKEIKDGFAARGTTPPEIKTSHIHVDGHTAFSAAYEQNDAAGKKTLRTWTVVIPAKNGSCVMTCSALKSQWAEAGPVFKSVINSLKFDDVPTE